MISITLVLDLNTLAFLGLGDNVLYNSRLCRLVSGSYSKIHDSSPVTTLFSKLGSVSHCSKMSWHIRLCRSFCPFCTIFAQIFLIPRSSVMILHTLSLFTQFICYYFNSKTAIVSHLLSHTLNIFICFACGWPPTPVIIFHLLFSLFEPPVPLKKMSS